jgi:hypothetical protein
MRGVSGAYRGLSSADRDEAEVWGGEAGAQAEQTHLPATA